MLSQFRSRRHFAAIVVILVAFLASLAPAVAISHRSASASSLIVPTLSCSAVSWTNRVNAVQVGTGGTLQKSGGVPYTWDAGASSSQSALSGDAYVEATVDSLDTYRMFGLSSGDSGPGFGEIKFAAYLAGNTLKVFEHGVGRGSFGTLAVGDRVRVSVEAGVVRYYRNGAPFYTSNVQPTYPVLVDSSISDPNALVQNTTFCAATAENGTPAATATTTARPATSTSIPSATSVPPTMTSLPSATVPATIPAPAGCQAVAWVDIQNVVAQSNSIHKVAGVSSTWDAGAVSTQLLQTSGGSVQATADDTATYKLFGLSHDDANPTQNDVEYALFMAGGTLKVYENGVLRLNAGTYAVGDVLKVAAEAGNVVRYYRNEALIYTSTVAPVYPLMFDSSINSLGGWVNNGMVCGFGPAAATPTSQPSPPASTSTPAQTFTFTASPTATPVATQIPTNTYTRTASPSATKTLAATSTPTFTAVASATNTRTRTATATATLAATLTPTPIPTQAAGCQYFPADNIWNRNIANVPVHSNSNNFINRMGASFTLHPDFGSGTWGGGPIGIPYVIVSAGQQRVAIHYTAYGNESDAGPFPVPTNAPIEGGTNGTGDRHVLVVDRDNCMLYELYHAYPNADGSWNAGSGAKWSMGSDALRPNGWTSADAAGLPVFPGLVRYDEVAAGAIRHAMRFTADASQMAHLWPARHDASNSTDPNLPPMGLRLRLKAGVNISGYSANVRVILQALKDYGMFMSDNDGGSNQIGLIGAPDSRWNNSDLVSSLSNIHLSDFEAVDESGLMVDSNSGQSR